MGNMKKQARREHVPADFRKVIGGMKGEIPWTPLFTGKLDGWREFGESPVHDRQLPTGWQIAGNGLAGESDIGSCLATGDASWTDYELSLLITLLKGGNAQVFFRLDDRLPAKGYVFDMMLGWQAVQVCKLEVDSIGSPRVTRLSVVNYPMEREYAVSIAARGQSITTYIDGAIVNQLTDASLAGGGVGLNVWQAKTLFRDIQVRRLN
jgi:hypothetical protein